MPTDLLTALPRSTPTLGQSLRSFVFQIAGSGMGYIVGLISSCIQLSERECH